MVETVVAVEVVAVMAVEMIEEDMVTGQVVAVTSEFQFDSILKSKMGFEMNTGAKEKILKAPNG